MPSVWAGPLEADYTVLFWRASSCFFAPIHCSSLQEAICVSEVRLKSLGGSELFYKLYCEISLNTLGTQCLRNGTAR